MIKNIKNYCIILSWESVRKITIVVFIAFSLVACQNSHQREKNYLSTSACAKIKQNGKILECEVDKELDNRMSRFIEFSIKLDKSHPSPKGPNVKNLAKSELYDVERIDQNNIIYVNNGLKLSLAGLHCKGESDFHKYLAAILLGQHKYKISYELTGLKDGDVEYAYIWEVGSDLSSVSSINEAAITNQWCEPVTQEKHNYHIRYQLLSDYAKSSYRASKALSD